MKKKHKRKRVKIDKTIITFCFFAFLFSYLALFKLPLFSREKIKTVTGIISNISIAQRKGRWGRNQVLYFDIDHNSYYFPISNVVKDADVDPLLLALQACESSQETVSIEITSEKDYRDFKLSNGRGHAIALSFGEQSIPLDAYKKDVTMVRTVLLICASGFLLMLVIYIFVSYKVS